MKLFIISIISFLITATAYGQSLNLLPKYGSMAKTASQIESDNQFIQSIDKYYQGDRKKGASDVSKRAWSLLREGKSQDAMRRFNQAWLLDPSNGEAIWGMAAIQANGGKTSDALSLFDEAKNLMGNDIDFSVDYARGIGMIGIETGNKALIQNSFEMFEKNQFRAPEHTMNLQNWAIVLFYLEDYKGAWQKVKLAEKTKRASEMDKGFVEALTQKMPRP